MRTSYLLPTDEEQADEMRNILWSKYPKPICKSSDKILEEEKFPSHLSSINRRIEKE